MKWISDYGAPKWMDIKFMNSIRIGLNLKRLLRSRGLTLKRVSEKTGIPYSTLHTWLENRQPKDILKVKALAAYFGVGLDFLLFGDEENVPEALDLPARPGGLVGIYEVIVRRKE